MGSSVDWSVVPDEFVRTTFSFLERAEFVSFASIDQRNYSISKEALLWQEVCQLKLGKHSRCKFHRIRDPLPLPCLSSQWKYFFQYHFNILTPRDWNSIHGPTQKLQSLGQPNKHFNGEVHVTVDRDGRIIVSESGSHKIQVFSPSGEFLHSFGEEGPAVGQLDCPCGIVVDEQNRILVVESSNHRISIFDCNGNYLGSFGSKGDGNGQLNNPFEITIDRKQNRHIITDCLNHRVSIFDENGEWVFSFGSRGNQNGQFEFPTGVAVSDEGRILVADYNHRIQIFTGDGEFLFTFGSYGFETGFLFYPHGIVVDEHTSNVFVADQNNKRVQIFSSQGEFQHALTHFGSRPDGLVIDREQRLMVGEYSGCISIF